MLHSFLFKNKTPDFERMASFGFKKEKNDYVYRAEILGGQFTLDVRVSPDGNVKTTVTDTDSEGEYILHQIPESTGSFVESVRRDYMKVLREIAGQCFERKVFKSEYAANIIRYVREKYGCEFEFLWEKFPENAVVRRKDNKKWYAALLTAAKNKVGLPGEELIEIIDLRAKPEDIALITDYKKYFPGFHMNKKSWITICLNGSVCFEEIRSRIDESYVLAAKK